jgi:hypothetical protein
MGTIGMKMRNTAEGIARRAAAHRAVLDDLVRQMYADYQRPMTLHAVGAKYGRTHSCIRELFERRGLAVRPFKAIARQPNGSPMPLVPLTAPQIDALIAKATRLCVPPALKYEWRRWSLARRGEFITRIRAKLNLPTNRPHGPFSANVEPFDYASPVAHAVARKMNAGRTSRTASVMIHINSQGVIYRGKLYFWAPDRVGCRSGAYYIGPWRPGTGRPSLHHVIWREVHGPIPAGHVVRYSDGNPNNLDPANLTLATQNDVARENQAAALLRKSREATALLLDRAQTKRKPHDHIDTVKLLRSSR